MYMSIIIVLKTLLILRCCEWCMTIRVPVEWNDDGSIERPETDSDNDNSEVQNEKTNKYSDFSIETFEPGNVDSYSGTSVSNKPLPAEYFEYTAKKPQFAIDVAAFHGVKSPEKHYRASPIRPYTGFRKPQLGKHYANEEDKLFFTPFNRYTRNHDRLKSNMAPILSNYEVYHPYKAEEPALQGLYRDPTLLKIRNDIRDNKNRLQKYEKESGEPNVSKDDYLKSPDDVDKERFPHSIEPEEYKIHRTQRRPVYYKRPHIHSRNNYLNRKLKHPLHQNYIKIKPANYRPLQMRIQRLKQQQFQKYDDEHNEYPQEKLGERFAEPPEGYDIYEKGKEKYVELRNNVDTAINQAVIDNRPNLYKKLELQDSGESNEEDSRYHEDEEEFVPIKNYAQVRRTETTKHLPREAALDEATSYDEIINAPRLKEAVKSTKAQTVYTEEGYEDSAYDHAGEQKHASDHEAHNGYLKQKEASQGKFKIPSISGSFKKAHGSQSIDEKIRGKKWINNEKDTKKEVDKGGYNSNEDEYDSAVYQDNSDDSEKRDKRNVEIDAKKNVTSEHEVNKREVNFEVPNISLSDTYLTEAEILELSKKRIQPSQKLTYLNNKYPYYNKDSVQLNKDSPLRYAENLKLIPKKTKGGTEFYDSRSWFECPEVDEDIDPIPKNIKEKEGEDQSNEKDKEVIRNKRQADFDNLKEKPRLKGLGDKIDCFKAKYFGENPLDSPFFKEEIIVNPEPISIPEVPTYKINNIPLINDQETKSNNVYSIAKKLREDNQKDIFDLIEKLKEGRLDIKEKLKPDGELNTATHNNFSNNDIRNTTHHTDQSNIYTDIIQNIGNNNLQRPNLYDHNKINLNLLGRQEQNSTNNDSIIYNSFNNKEDVTKLPSMLRRKRSTSFVYEPYKVIRDNHAKESKKTTTLTNVSPLIKQLQFSKVVDVIPSNLDHKMKKERQPVKRNVALRNYKDIGKENRSKTAIILDTTTRPSSKGNPQFIDIHQAKRRGEPRYENIHLNHRERYTPAKDIKSISVDDFKAQASNIQGITSKRSNKDANDEIQTPTIKQKLVPRKSTLDPYFDVSAYIPKTIEPKYSASRNIQKVIATTTPPNNNKANYEQELEEYYDDEYDYDEEDVTTTTTIRSPLRIRNTKVVSSTTQEPDKIEDLKTTTVRPKLRLVTRFRQPSEIEDQLKESNINNKSKKESPKFIQKTKKSSKSTLQTDSKTYGEGNDDMRVEEVDAMIGIQQQTDDYMPEYEKQENKKYTSQEDVKDESSNSEETDSTTENDENEYVDDEDEYEDEEEDDNEADDEESEEEDKEESVHDNNNNPKSETLIEKSETRTEKHVKPILVQKKIEIHKEMPINKSSPHIKQFKEDIVEEEIVEELPQKNIEALELYKDERLPNDVNKLADVEVFKTDIDFEKGPKHGGNYRSIATTKRKVKDKNNSENMDDAKDDAETSQTENAKSIKISDEKLSRQGLYVRNSNMKGGRRYNNRGRLRHANIVAQSIKKPPIKSKEEEKEKSTTIKIRPMRRRVQKQKSAKLELQDNDENNARSMHGGNLKSIKDIPRFINIRQKYRGNYKKAKKEDIETDEADKEEVEHEDKLRSLAKSGVDGRSKAADLLNSFAQVVPILTTTPPYILDPSKRMYYYVD